MKKNGKALTISEKLFDLTHRQLLLLWQISQSPNREMIVCRDDSGVVSSLFKLGLVYKQGRQGRLVKWTCCPLGVPERQILRDLASRSAETIERVKVEQNELLRKEIEMLRLRISSIENNHFLQVGEANTSPAETKIINNNSRKVGE